MSGRGQVPIKPGKRCDDSKQPTHSISPQRFEVKRILVWGPLPHRIRLSIDIHPSRVRVCVGREAALRLDGSHRLVGKDRVVPATGQGGWASRVGGRSLGRWRVGRRRVGHQQVTLPREGKRRQEKAREGKRRQEKASQGKPRQAKARETGSIALCIEHGTNRHLQT